jgi:hypothetical protein
MDGLALPKPLAQLFAKLNLHADDCRRSDGRYSFPYDGGRLDIHIVRRGNVILETSLVSLPADPAARKRLIESALKISTARMKYYCDTLAQAPARNELVLQRQMASNEPMHECESIIKQFLNSVDRWRNMLKAM